MGQCYENAALPNYFRRVEHIEESITRPGGKVVVWNTDGFEVQDRTLRTRGRCGIRTFADWATGQVGPVDSTPRLQSHEGMWRCRGRCGEVLPATTEFFHRDKNGPKGLRSVCKACYSELPSIVSRTKTRALRAVSGDSVTVDAVDAMDVLFSLGRR